MKEITNNFTDFIANLKDDNFNDYQKYFCNLADQFEFEIEAFKDFIQKQELSYDKIDFVDETRKIAKLIYKHKESDNSTERSGHTTWFPMKKSKGVWKVSNKGEYLKCLAESKKWRKIKTEHIIFYFDSFLKKTLDQVNAESGASEFNKMKKYLNLDDELKISYFVYDDEKSLHELGFNSNISGQNWIISNHPCDVFQLVSLCVKRANPELPKYLMYGFSTYYAYYISKSTFPVFNFPRQDFDMLALNSIKYGYYIKILKLLNNLEFHKWTEMVSIMSILSQQKSHPSLTIFLTSASFIKFLFENDAIGKNDEIRKKRILDIIKSGKEKDFENTFKKITGLKIKKAEKLWKKDLKIRTKNS